MSEMFTFCPLFVLTVRAAGTLRPSVKGTPVGEKPGLSMLGRGEKEGKGCRGDQAGLGDRSGDTLDCRRAWSVKHDKGVDREWKGS